MGTFFGRLSKLSDDCCADVNPKQSTALALRKKLTILRLSRPLSEDHPGKPALVRILAINVKCSVFLKDLILALLQFFLDLRNFPMPGSFVISLDFELMWGVRDHSTIETYGKNILGGRQAIPRILASFNRRSIRATWATVGLLFFDSKEELISHLPEEKPTYTNKKLSNYQYICEIGKDEKTDPYYFGGSLLKQISDCPGQEIASHSFSHYYCKEEGQTTSQFSADMNAAVNAAAIKGYSLRSFVFPRNQFSQPHLSILSEHGISVMRGNEQSWFYEASSKHSHLQRAGRLVDTYFNLSGFHVQDFQPGQLTDVPSSRFLRPYSRRLSWVNFLALRRICNAMKQAVVTDGIFHLWWHPHNFGNNLEENMNMLDSILDYYTHLHEHHGMKSLNMGDFS